MVCSEESLMWCLLHHGSLWRWYLLYRKKYNVCYILALNFCFVQKSEDILKVIMFLIFSILYRVVIHVCTIQECTMAYQKYIYQYFSLPLFLALHCGSRKCHPFYILNDCVRYLSILIKIDRQHCEETCYKYFWPPCLKTVTTLPCEIRESSHN